MACFVKPIFKSRFHPEYLLFEHFSQFHQKEEIKTFIYINLYNIYRFKVNNVIAPYIRLTVDYVTEEGFYSILQATGIGEKRFLIPEPPE